MSRTQRVLKKIRNISIAAGIIILVLVGVGVGYTWYAGKTSPQQQIVPEDTTPDTSAAPIKHTDISPDAPESASIQSLTTPVAPGDNASVYVKTNPGSWCTITAVYNKVKSQDSGLIGKTADEYGTISWSWTVESSVPVGKWPVTITCIRNTKSAVVIGDLEVSTTKTDT